MGQVNELAVELPQVLSWCYSAPLLVGSLVDCGSGDREVALEDLSDYFCFLYVMSALGESAGFP